MLSPIAATPAPASSSSKPESVAHASPIASSSSDSGSESSSDTDSSSDEAADDGAAAQAPAITPPPPADVPPHSSPKPEEDTKRRWNLASYLHENSVKNEASSPPSPLRTINSSQLPLGSKKGMGHSKRSVVFHRCWGRKCFLLFFRGT